MLIQDGLVYVSAKCVGMQLCLRLSRLCKAQSKRLKKNPFVPVKAIAVDLFPHTMHCELVMLFERD